MIDVNPSLASQVSEEPTRHHGGRAGWFRVAGGFSALLTLGSALEVWQAARPSTAAPGEYPSWFVALLLVATACFGWASLLALRQRQQAGLWLALGYFLPAIALYAAREVVAPPNGLLVVILLALIAAGPRRRPTTGLAA